jgi:hypothetical protein
VAGCTRMRFKKNTYVMQEMKDEHVYYARANYIKSDKESKRMSKKVL